MDSMDDIDDIYPDGSNRLHSGTVAMRAEYLGVPVDLMEMMDSDEIMPIDYWVHERSLHASQDAFIDALIQEFDR